MRLRSTGRPSGGRDALIAAVWGLLFGLALHLVTVWFGDYGPSWPGFSLRGNGAIVFLLLYPVAVIMGWAYYIPRRSWLAIVVLPVAMFLGLFVLLGPV